MGLPAQKEPDLIECMEEFVDDALGYVLFAFRWGEGELADWDGPDEWQEKVLRRIGEKCLTVEEAIRIAVASGHGIGKTALIAWIILWFMSTRPFPQIVVTANTKEQLTSKTWRELARWHKRAVNRSWFKWTATKFYNINHPEDWFASAIPWSKERADAFSGTHEGHVLMIFDEASMVDDLIWERADGAMTTTGAMFIAFGNPSLNQGRFFECFHKFRHRWHTMQIDSRTTKVATNKKEMAQWVQDYGEDSDFVRVRVRGVFPRAGSAQLIGHDLVRGALGKHLRKVVYMRAPKILCADVARFGDDQSVMIRRQGLAASGLVKFRGLDLMTYAGRIAEEYARWMPDALFVDEGGVGGGVVDRLRQLHVPVIPVNFGAKASNDERYANLRAEMWDKMRLWLEAGGAIPDDPELRDDLTGPMYFYDIRDRIILEKKEDMKKRGLASPDNADALAMSFARPVFKRSSGLPGRPKYYDPLAPREPGRA